MRQFTLAATGLAFAALLSSAPAMAQAYNTDLIGWNRGGKYIEDTAGHTQMCFKDDKGKFAGPVLTGTSDAAIVGGEAGFCARAGDGCERSRGDEKGAIQVRALWCPAAAAIILSEPAQFRLHG